jgi:hypothetical protein
MLVSALASPASILPAPTSERHTTCEVLIAAGLQRCDLRGRENPLIGSAPRDTSG